MEHEAFIEEAWAKSESAVKRILEKGADVYMQEQSSVESAFAEAERTCACVDERVGGEKMGLPGSGILLGKEKATEIIRAEGLEKISSHEHCGAAALAYNKLAPEEQAFYGTADAYAQSWTKELADELGIQYQGHVAVDGDQHVARVVYYDGTGRFTPTSIESLPQGFLVSRAEADPKQTASGVALAAKIALGDHGFGASRFATSPLVIIPVGESSLLSKLHEEIEEALKDVPNKDLIHIDLGITASARAESSKAA